MKHTICWLKKAVLRLESAEEFSRDSGQPHAADDCRELRNRALTELAEHHLDGRATVPPEMLRRIDSVFGAQWRQFH